MPFLRYISTALILKVFSANNIFRKAYRFLGNKLSRKRHSSNSSVSIRRGLWLLETVEKAGLSLDNHSTVLELGTGWTHYYGIFLRLFYSPETYLFDVWDNRQLEAIKQRTAELYEPLRTVLPSKWNDHLEAIYEITQKIATVDSYDDLYNLLNMHYILEPNGNLDSFNSNTFDMIFSGDVMEHIHRGTLESTIKNMYRILKPGGISVHQIGIDDHLTHYAPGMSTKNYVRYSDKTWRLFFENRVQYFNRVQLPEFNELFLRNNFQLSSCEIEEDKNSLSRITPAPQYKIFDKETLQTVRAYIVHRK